jgi:hypothetical protein
MKNGGGEPKKDEERGREGRGLIRREENVSEAKPSQARR